MSERQATNGIIHDIRKQTRQFKSPEHDWMSSSSSKSVHDKEREAKSESQRESSKRESPFYSFFDAIEFLSNGQTTSD
jgi:hypothetical protein